MNLLYLSYGSNLHPVRLQDRIPSASLIGTVELPGQVISFHKRSRDGSGKCTLMQGDESQAVFAAVYEIRFREKKLLDRIEGVGAGYEVHWEELEVCGTRVRVFMYIGSDSHIDKTLIPYRWYKSLVLAGARYHRFPDAYVKLLETVKAIDDPNEERRKANEALLDSLSADDVLK